MSDKYFDDLFNEGNVSFPELLNRFDSYPPVAYSFMDSPLAAPVELNFESSYLAINEPQEIIDMNENKVPYEDHKNPEVPTEISKVKKKSKSKAKEAQEIQESKKPTRAERNRKYAKDSRERKRKYVENLESTIKTLTAELDQYKKRLKKYEVIEKYLNSVGYEFYETLTRIRNEMYMKNQSINDTELFLKNFHAYEKRRLDEQLEALEMLTKTMAEIVLPVPMRISLWMAENSKVEPNKKKFDMIVKRLFSEDQLKEISDHCEKHDPGGKNCAMISKCILDIGTILKKDLKELVDWYKKVKSKLLMFHNNMEIYGSSNTLYSFGVLAKTAPQLASDPNIRNSAITQLFENLAVTNEASEDLADKAGS